MRGQADVTLDPTYFNYHCCVCSDGFFWNATILECAAIPTKRSFTTARSLRVFERAGAVGSEQFAISQGLYPLELAVAALAETNGDAINLADLTNATVPELTLKLCYVEEQCNNNATPTDEASFQCRKGSTGFLCSKCQAKFYSTGHVCQKCPENQVTMSILAACVSVIVLIAYLIFHWRAQPNTSGLFAITLFYVQTLSLLSQTSTFSTPSIGSEHDLVALHAMASISDFFRMSMLTLPRTECIFPGFDLKAQMWVACFTGPALAVLCAPTLLFQQQDQVANRQTSQVPVKTIRMYIFLMNIAFVHVVSTIILWLNCTPLTTDSTVYFHTLRPYSRCHIGAAMGLGIPMLCIYGCVFPLCITAHIMKRNIAHPSEIDVRFLFSMYKPKHSWWVAVVFFRRFLVPVFLQAFKFRDPSSTFNLFALLVVSAVLVAYFRPYLRLRDNLLDTFTLVVLIITYFFAGT
jgi:hypothetical protein